MGDQHLALDASLGCRCLGRQVAVEGRDRIQFNTAPRHVQHHPATEAIADRRDLVGIGARVVLEQLLRGLETRDRRIEVAKNPAAELLGIIRVVRRLAVSVHIDRERSFFRQHLRPGLCVFANGRAAQTSFWARDNAPPWRRRRPRTSGLEFIYAFGPGLLLSTNCHIRRLWCRSP